MASISGKCILIANKLHFKFECIVFFISDLFLFSRFIATHILGLGNFEFLFLLVLDSSVKWKYFIKYQIPQYQAPYILCLTG